MFTVFQNAADKAVIVNMSTITHVEGTDDKVVIHFVGGAKVTVKGKLADVASALGVKPSGATGGMAVWE
jgi:hypothetical protein